MKQLNQHRDMLKQLKASLEQVKTRYQELLRTVAENNTSRRVQMDSHAHALLERTYPQEIRDRFSHLSLPAYSYLAAHASESALVRHSRLAESFEQLEEAVGSFLEEYRTAAGALEEWTAEASSGGQYHLDLLLVEIEDRESGERRLEVVGPEGYAELPADLRQRIEQQAAAIQEGAEHRDIDDDDRRQLEERLREAGVGATEIARFHSEQISVFAAGQENRRP